MMHTMLKQAINNAVAMGPAVLLQDMQLQNPMCAVKSATLSADDCRVILAARASDFGAVNSKPALRQLPGTAPVSIDELQSDLKELDLGEGI
jgi:hypothetical protein